MHVSSRSLLLPAIAITSLFVSALFGELTVRLVALFNPSVAHLANAGAGRMPPVLASFSDYLALRRNELRPHQSWRGYYLNDLGFNDQEFTPARKQGTTRLIALGDSFLYSMVDYPNNVMTLLETELSRRCNKPVEVLNFGVSGATAWDYKTVYSLEANRYDADFVLVHLYLGNDAPDTVNAKDWLPEPGRHSYLITLARNVYRLKTAERDEAGGIESARRSQEPIVGAQRAKGAEPLTDESPALSKPPHGEDVWQRTKREELMRLYVPPDSSALERSWSRIFDTLRALKEEIAKNGQRMVLVSYPSRLQVEDDVLNSAVAQFKHSKAPNFSRTSVDLELPTKVLSSFGAREGIPVIDLTEDIRRATASIRRSLYVPGDTHWNIAGNAAAAYAEGEKLREIVCPQ